MTRARSAAATFAALLTASSAAAEVAPQTLAAGGGLMSLGTYGKAYLPDVRSVALMAASLDARLSGRWSFNLRTLASVDQSISGFAVGGIYRFRPHALTSATGREGLMQVRTTVTPAWQPSIGFAVGRWGYSQTLRLSSPAVNAKLRDVPVRASLYGAQVSAALARTLGERWAVEASYVFTYGVAPDLTIIGHSVAAGPSYWF